jgi:hypothetical protein
MSTYLRKTNSGKTAVVTNQGRMPIIPPVNKTGLSPNYSTGALAVARVIKNPMARNPAGR